jgi:hypothetical protein
MHIKLEFMTRTSQVGKIEGEKERDGRCAVPTALGKNCHAKLYAPGFRLRVSEREREALAGPFFIACVSRVR